MEARNNPFSCSGGVNDDYTSLDAIVLPVATICECSQGPGLSWFKSIVSVSRLCPSCKSFRRGWMVRKYKLLVAFVSLAGSKCRWAAEIEYWAGDKARFRIMSQCGKDSKDKIYFPSCLLHVRGISSILGAHWLIAIRTSIVDDRKTMKHKSLLTRQLGDRR